MRNLRILLIVCLLVCLAPLPAAAQAVVESGEFLKTHSTPPRALTPAETAKVEKLLARHESANPLLERPPSELLGSARLSPAIRPCSTPSCQPLAHS